MLAACSNDFKLNEQSAALTVTPLVSDAGTLALGSEALLPLVLYAQDGDVSVISVDVLNVEGEWFTLQDSALPTVTNGETATLTVSYVPQEEGLHWARVTVNTNEATTPGHEVDVRGEGALPAARFYPSLLDFGPVRPGTLGTLGVTILNEGRVPLDLGAVAFDNDRYSLDTSLPVSVVVGGSATVGVTYAADDASEQTGEARFDIGASLDPLVLRANACSTASGDLYDSDGDGYSFCAGDCDDWDRGVNPGAIETCDSVDQACDGSVDEGTSCVDDDGDGFSEDDGDCNDGDTSVSPAAAEVDGNGVDDDCDGMTDDGSVDNDRDGYSTAAGDCDDGNRDVFPGAPEPADGLDNDCDGLVDEGTSVYDDDGDGYSEDRGDCDDSDPAVSPGRAEAPDFVDNDCDGTVDEGTVYFDDDGDGYTETGGDCNDANPSVNPGQPEVSGNHVDDNCDGVTS